MKSIHSQQQGNQDDQSDTTDPIKLIIGTIVKGDCDTLQSLVGDLTQAEENRKGLRKIHEVRKCSFNEIEYNYQLYRNLELNTGVELTQAAIEIKQNVANYIKLSDTLSAALRTVIANVKDAKKKFGDLRKAACDLNSCRNDKCNCNQMLILTGKPPSNSDDKKKAQGVTAACPDAAGILDSLIEKPAYFLSDSDTILTAAADTSGIQTFVNIKSIDQLQSDFSTAAKNFDTQVQAKMNQGLADLTQSQKDLTKATTDLTSAGYALYNKRDEVDAEMETIEYICEPKCDCIIKHNSDGEELYHDRFENCKREMCNICGKMDNHYCQREQPQDNQQYN